MPEVKTAHELASLLGSTLTSVDPIKALEAHGYTLSGELRQKLESMETVPKLSEEERQRWADQAKNFGPARFTLGEPSSFSLASLAPGEYDLILGFRMDLLHNALKGLYATHVIPHGLPADTDEELVIDVLRGWFDGIPDGEKIKTGTFHLTAAPTMSPVDGTERVSLHQPFELDIDRVSMGMFAGTVIREKVASLVGTVHLTMGVDVAVVKADQKPQLGVRLIPVDPLGNPPYEERFRIDVDAGSTIQPKGQQVLDDVVTLIALFLKRELESKKVWTVTPEIDLKEYTGGDDPLVVGSVDVRTVASPLSGAVMIGVRFGWPGSAPGDPQRLTNPFIDQSANFYTRVHVERVRKILQEMHESGELDRLAKEEHEDARIEAADVEFAENEIRIKLKGRIVDACGFWVDLPFQARHTIHFEFLPDRIRITRSTKIDVDDEDKALCFILSLLQAAVVGVAVGVATGGLPGIALGIIAGFYAGKDVPFFELAYDDLFGEGEGPEVSLFNLRTPIPGTELLPRIDGLSMRVGPENLEQFSLISLVPDEINTYLYVRFLSQPPLPGLRVKPISGAEVELLDQDFPKPNFDDAKIPLEEESIEIEEGAKVTVIKRFGPPQSDELLKVEKTDWTGLARFLLHPPEVETTAGTITTIRIKIFDLQPSETTSETTETPIRELFPDVYFRVRTPWGERSTRKLDEGLMVNLGMKHVGSADAPLTFVFKEPGLFA